MILTYEELKELLPKETLDYINKIIPYIHFYTRENRHIIVRNERETKSYSKSTIACFLSISLLSEDEKMGALFSRNGYVREQLCSNQEFSSPNLSIEQMFTQNNFFMPVYTDPLDYTKLLPIDIVIFNLKQYRKNSEDDCYFFRQSFNNSVHIADFLDKLDQERLNQKNALLKEIESDLYGNLSMSVISYIETASSIRRYILSNINGYNSIIKNNQEDVTALSLLFATFLYKDTENVYDDVTVSKALNKILASKSLSIEKLFSACSLSYSLNSIKGYERSVLAIKKYYKDYFTSGVVKDKPAEQITVIDILSNVFDRNFTGTLAVEKALEKLNCNVDMFDDLDSLVEKTLQELIIESKNKYVKSFYNELSKNVKDYIEFTAKTYTLLLKRMESGTHNTELLKSNDDADTLALLISSYYFNADTSKFFRDNGISLDKIYTLIGIKLKKEEIINTELDQKVLVDRFKRFVYTGVNSNKESKKISINDIDHNLCNREFNKTMIVEEIFHALSPKKDINSNFLSQLENHLKEKEAERKLQLTQKLFKDMPVSTIEFLERASKIHTAIKKDLKGYSKEDVKCLSLLISFLSEKSKLTSFLSSKGLRRSELISYLNINEYTLDNSSINIDLLDSEYGTYIFGGLIRGTERKDITTDKIFKNIFNRELNNSVNISRLLNHFNLSYEFFDNLDKHYQEYTYEQEEKRKLSEAKSKITDFGYFANLLLRGMLNAYTIISEKLNEGKINSPYISDSDDVFEFSVIYAMFNMSNESSRFFEKHGLTLDKFLSLNGLDKSMFDKINMEPNYLLANNEIFKRFLDVDIQGKSDMRASQLVKRIFDTNISKSLFLEKICANEGINYSILQEEVLTEKDYEVTLTVNDRISILEDSPLDPIDTDDMMSILHFGNSLTVHTEYIQDELPKLELNDTHDKSIATINSIMGRIYEKQEPEPVKQRGFLARLFFGEEETKPEPKLVINPNSVDELKSSIDGNISLLSKELLAYDSIRKYIEVYRKKNQGHYLVAKEAEMGLAKELSALDPRKDSDYDKYLRLSTLVRIMKEKTNRFATTNVIMQQELVKVNQAIMTHFITINALELAKHDLLPIIGSELAIAKGQSTESEALELSHSVVGLLQDLLSRNVNGAIQNMNNLKASGLSQEIYDSLGQSVQLYIDQLGTSREAEKHIEPLPIDGTETLLPSHDIKLVLSSDKENDLDITKKMKPSN